MSDVKPWNDWRHFRALMRSWAKLWRFEAQLCQAGYTDANPRHPLRCAINCRNVSHILKGGAA